MKIITVDFAGCKYLGEIHLILKRKFGFPDYYGENLDALWDCMRYYCEERLHIYIKGTSTLPELFSDYLSKMMTVFNRVHEESPNITFEIID